MINELDKSYFNVALATSLVLFGFDGEKLKILISQKVDAAADKGNVKEEARDGEKLKILKILYYLTNLEKNLLSKVQHGGVQESQFQKKNFLL